MAKIINDKYYTPIELAKHCIDKTYKILKATYGCRGCAFYKQTCVGINKIEKCFE